MKKCIISLSIFAFFLNTNIIFVKSSNWYEWEDSETGNYLNFYDLKRTYNDPWVFTKTTGTFSDIYQFNFGDLVNKNCFGRTGSIIESFEIMNQQASTCTVLGDYRDRKVRYIDAIDKNKGVYLEYSGKEICMHSFSGNDSTYRSVRFYLMCSENQEDQFIRYYDDSIKHQSCLIAFKLNTPAGCSYSGIRLLKNSKKILCYIFLFFLVYLFIGIFYNKKFRELHGKESIPNIEFWRNMPSLVIDGFIFTSKKLGNLFKRIKNKIHNNSNDIYNNV